VELENKDGVLYLKGTNNCLGYLMDFKDKGVYDVEYGRMDVTPEDADRHNKLFDEMLINGLDDNCEVGQCGTFYIDNPPTRVTTFLGTLVSADLTVTRNKRTGTYAVTFRRKGKRFYGRTHAEEDLFHFERTE
jgi:hypothetical protein